MRQRGFTLLELMVVLAILALATLLALPAGTAVLQRTSLDTAARDLGDDLVRARALAIERQDETVLRLDAAGRRWQVGDGPVRDASAAVDGLDLALPEAGRDAAGVPAVRFFAEGASTGGRLVLRRGGRRETVTVDWLTGRVARGG